MRRRLILLMLLWSAPAGTQAPGNALAAPVLAVHNRERALVGLPPLVWDAGLAAGAAAYASRLAALGRLQHSSRDSRGGAGENLAMGTQGHYSPAELARLWAAEKSNFVNGVFPNVSRRGGWGTVGHYTQMIWRGTTNLGCGTATGGGNLYLVCRYAPTGNFIGRRVY